MSLAVVLIFYFFWQNYSLLAAVYSWLVSLSSFMVWAYWAEARPYALFFFLTTLQIFFFLKLFKKNGSSRPQWLGLIVTHFLLSLTAVLSLIQIVIVSAALWLFKDKDWKKYIGVTIVPSLLTIFYYLEAPKFNFWFLNTPQEVLGASYPVDRLFFVGLFVGALLLSFMQKRVPKLGQFRLINDNEFLEKLPFLMVTAGMLLGAYAFVMLLKFKEVLPEVSVDIPSFQVSARYFIFLAPFSIYATVLFTVAIFRSLRLRSFQILFFLGVGALLAIRLLKTVSYIKELYPGLL